LFVPAMGSPARDSAAALRGRLQAADERYARDMARVAALLVERDAELEPLRASLHQFRAAATALEADTRAMASELTSTRVRVRVLEAQALATAPMAVSTSHNFVQATTSCLALSDATTSPVRNPPPLPPPPPRTRDAATQATDRELVLFLRGARSELEAAERQHSEVQAALQEECRSLAARAKRAEAAAAAARTSRSPAPARLKLTRCEVALDEATDDARRERTRRRLLETELARLKALPPAAAHARAEAAEAALAAALARAAGAEDRAARHGAVAGALAAEARARLAVDGELAGVVCGAAADLAPAVQLVSDSLDAGALVGLDDFAATGAMPRSAVTWAGETLEDIVSSVLHGKQAPDEDALGQRLRDLPAATQHRAALAAGKACARDVARLRAALLTAASNAISSSCIVQ
jgi:hypothetical protein